MPPTPFRRPDPARLEALRARIRRLGGHPGKGRRGVLALGAAAIDGALPWGGLPRAALHEVIGRPGAASGFAAALLARFAGPRGVVLWCRRERGLYGPGLAALGLDSARLIVVRGRTHRDVLWAMEEGLRSGAPAAVLGEADGARPVALRRLQLAAETGGVAALLLHRDNRQNPPSITAAVTRWRVAAAPAAGDAPRWRLDLVRCRGGGSRSWLVEWPHGTTGDFVVAADLSHRQAGTAASDANLSHAKQAG